MRGSGKTTVARKLVAELSADRPLLIIDPHPEQEYADLCPSFCWTASELADKLLAGERHIRMLSMDPEEMEDFCVLAVEIDNALIVIDEADAFLRTNHNPDAFNFLLNYGRHHGQGVILIARRPADLPRGFTAQSFLFFPMSQEPRDAEYLRKRLGHDPPPLGPLEFAAHSRYGELEVLTPEWASAYRTQKVGQE